MITFNPPTYREMSIVGNRKPALVKMLLDAVSMKQSPSFTSSDSSSSNNNNNNYYYNHSVINNINNKVDFGLLRYTVNEVSQVRVEVRMKDLVFRCTTLLESAIDSYLLNNQTDTLRQVLSSLSLSHSLNPLNCSITTIADIEMF